MKEQLFRWIFKKEIHNLQSKFEYEKNKMSSENMKLENKLKSAEYSIPKRAFSMFPNCEIIGITTNPKNDDEEVYIIKTRYESNFYIYLMSKTYQTINGLPRIMFYIRTDVVDRNQHYIYIQDIITVDDSVGNGRILMEYFLKTAKDLKVKYVEGVLSSTDYGHFDRLEAYYKRFGFEVKFNEGRVSGSVKKFL